MDRPLRLASLLLLLLAPLRAGAQEAAPLPLDSVVVTATREPTAARLTGRRTVVWTAADLSALPASSYDELLRAAAGLEVQSRGGFGVQSDLTLRGSTFNGVLVLLDGVRLNDPMTGHFLADLPLPLSEIARVEVLRGPASALYGPDALGGVVHLFTHTALAQLSDAAPAPHAHAAARAGRHALVEADAAVRVPLRGGLAGAATTVQRSDGMPVLQGGAPVVGSQGPVRTDFLRHAHTAAFGRRTAAGALFGRLGVDRRDFSAFHFYTPFASDTARERTATLWLQTRLSGGLPGGARGELHLAARQHEDVYVYNPVTPANHHTSRRATLHGQATRPLGRSLVLTGGAAASLRGIDSNNLGRHADASAGGFALGFWQPRPALSLSGGAHLEYDGGYGLEVTPQASAAYGAGPLALRASAGRAVRAPNYVERYINARLARPRGRDYGNPSLRPERAWSWEIGADAAPAAGLSAHVTWHHRTVRDLIDYVRLTPADTLFRARNLLDARTRGLELEARLRRPLAGPGRLMLQLSYAYLDTRLGGLPAGASSKYALTHARHLVQGAAVLGAGPAQLGLRALWKERLEGASYGVIDLSAALRLPFRPPLSLTAEIRNLLDAAYSEVFDAPMPGRWWIVGIGIGNR